MRNLRAISTARRLAIPIVLLATVLSLAAPAHAAPAQPAPAVPAVAGDYQACPQYFVCAWVDRNFTGPMGRWEHDNADWGDFPNSNCGNGTWDDCASSVYNHGQTCDVWLWSGVIYTGSSLYLYRGSRLAFLNVNPGPSPVGSWEDIIKSNHWCTPN